MFASLPADMHFQTARTLAWCIVDVGAQLGWLIDLDGRTVELYRPDREAEKLTDADEVEGDGPVTDFVLDLKRLWEPFAG